MSRLTRLRRSIAFARHVPVGQLLARARLTVQRRRSLKSPPSLDGLAPGQLQPAPNPPAPRFPPRTGQVERTATGWRFTFLGRAVDMGETIDWDAPGPGVANQLWRMNLHYMEYLEGLDAAAGVDLINQWIAANPPWQPGYWHDSWNSYTLSLRVVVWMQRIAAWGIDRADPALGPIHASLAQQLAFLERNLELDIGGNHLVKNIKALSWGAAFFSGAIAERWRARALDLLDKELARQVLADGVHYERSPSYHAQVFADLIETRDALGPAAPPALDRALDGMARATVLLAHPDGAPALFNDAGLTMAYAPVECLTAYTGSTGRAVPQPQGGFALPTAGYFGLHTQLLTLIADQGRIGPDDLPAHAHGDIGSIELSVAGQRMIVDQGVFEYVPGTRRDQSRSAHHHNVLAIDGAEPADFFGAFRCGRRPRVWVSEAEVQPDALTLAGGHDGYAHLPGRPIVSRRIEAHGDTIRLHDRIEGAVSHSASWRMLLHPECEATLDGTTATLRRGDAQLTIHASQPLRLEAATWWPDMGHESSTQRLCLTLPDGCFESEVIFMAASVGENGA
ncbi:MULTISPECIES: heparinase II/III family protein [unclassified Sphingomonas]|uniref:heparinase II/III family protein n=1 Tax=unclassified Sphingomonas TaxID=196159 RepID=UPI0008303FD1|nr:MULTISPECIES: heparinase II/III family protein [unclassified Sphingomonas]